MTMRNVNMQQVVVKAILGAVVWIVVAVLPGGVVAQTRLLDADRDAVYAAYSLRRLSSTYDGPTLRVRRSRDNAEQDIGFGSAGFIDTVALTAFVGAGDGYVVVWYDQGPNGYHVRQSNPDAQPILVQNGAVLRAETGDPALRFEDAATNPAGVNRYLSVVDVTRPLSSTDYMLAALVEQVGYNGEPTIVSVSPRGRAHEGIAYRAVHSYINGNDAKARIGGTSFNSEAFLPVILRNRGDRAEFWQGNTLLWTGAEAEEEELASSRNNLDDIEIGGDNFTGHISEVVIYGAYEAIHPLDYYRDMAAAFIAGVPLWNEDAILPQTYPYQVVLYDWLESLTVGDVTLEMGQTFTFDPSLLTDDELADLHHYAEVISTSRVVRGEPEWYVLDAGNGKGIEATGEVRVWHEPGSGYGGNPPRSWANEPAQLYQLDIPLPGGGQGNPYYKDPAMGRRAMVVAIVDMMMYHQDLLAGGTATWGDMYGKAFLGWAEAYRWAGEVLPADVQEAFEEGMTYFLDFAVTSDDASPRAVNTNMDMFFIHGCAEFYMATRHPERQAKALAAVKDWLFGYPDGELEVKHKVFALDGTLPRGGVFSPSGFIMEGDQPDIFYGGESLYHLAGAVAAVMDRETGAVPPEWDFMKEVVRRFQEWRLYQYWYEPGVAAPGMGGIRAARWYHGGAGFTGRTGAGVPSGQASGDKYKVIGDLYPELIYDGLYSREHRPALKSRSQMVSDISKDLASRTSEMAAVYEGMPNTWKGWSPWTKETGYLPARGWYSRFKALENDPSTYPPSGRPGYYYSKPFGGPPVGYEYWAYKNTDGQREWGFFMEAQARQGGYGGWYGGKIETFWTETTGVVLINRHGKGGCDGDKEDAGCWDNIDYKAGHHVWGRDEQGHAFSTLRLRGQGLSRTSTFDLDAANPSVEVVNVFNDPYHADNSTSSRTGEETGYELEGAVRIANKVEALTNGARVTHTVTSDGTDEVTELWASIPVHLRMYGETPGDKPQADLDDTTIEYWDGASWQPMPEDRDGDGVPELVTTTKLRLGRDFKLGDGPQYVYVGFPDGPQRTRLSTQIYMDPYQTKTRVRTVHFDLHGNPGTAMPMPTNKVLRYDIVTQDPAVESGKNTPVTQAVALQQGWNLVGGYVQPAGSSIDQLFSSVLASIAIVKDEQGRIFSPEYDINTIGSWQPGEAYQVYAREAVTLSVTGVPLVPSETPVALKAGWNLVPFIGAAAMPVSEALHGIRDAVVILKDNDGNVYYPEAGLDQVKRLRPGRGYKLYVDRDVTLYYPD